MSKRSNSDVGMKKDTHLTSTSVALNRRRFSLGLPLLAAGAAAPQEVVAAKAPSRDEAPIVKLNTFRAKLCRKHAHARDIATRPIEANRRLLRACRQRPNCCRATEKRDEIATLHSITSSARASKVGGTSMPSAFAVLRFNTSSNFVACSTGRSAGLIPCRVLCT